VNRALLVVVLFAAPGALAEPLPVTLTGALKLAAFQNPELAVARAQAQVAQGGLQRAWTAWQPDVSASATYDHTSAPQAFDVGGLVGLNQAVFGLPIRNPAAIPGPVDLVAANSLYGTLQVVQPLFTPQGAFLVSAARSGAEAAELGASEAREQILLGTARAFLSLKAVRELIGAARDAEHTALERETQARRRQEAGVGLPVELARAQSQTAQARAQLAALEGSEVSLEATLQQLTGAPITPQAQDDAPFGEPGEASDQPWAQTFAVQAARAQLDAARKVMRYDSFTWLPTLAGVAKGNYNSNTGFSGKHTSYDLILTASVPLYDRGTRYAARSEDEGKLAAAEAGLRAAQARSRAAWESARANLTAARASLSQSQAALTLAEQARAQVEASRQSGSSTNLELAEADSQRFLAASSLAQAKATVAIRGVEVAASEGRLFRSLTP
jgi:outer membrane protein